MGIFKNMGGKIPGGNFLAGNFLLAIHQTGVWLIRIFRVGVFLIPVFLYDKEIYVFRNVGWFSYPTANYIQLTVFYSGFIL